MKKRDALIGRGIRLNRKKLEVAKEKDYAEVVFLGDVHWGSRQCDKNRFLRMVEHCVKNDVYVMLMGD